MTTRHIIQFQEWPCTASFLTYENGRTAIRLDHAEELDPVAWATVNVPEVELAEGEVILKTWSENAGMLEAMTEAGIVELTGRVIVRDFSTHQVEMPVCRVTGR